jgi:class I fructose-bisphosphate aldolase
MEVDLTKITKNGRAMFLAYDQGMEHGTAADFTDANIDPQKILNIAEKGGFTGVIFQKGIAEKYYQPQTNQVPLIVKLNGKTQLRAETDEPYASQLCTVDEAVELGAQAVGYTVYVGSQFENKMMQKFSKIEQEAEKTNLPVIAWMYPRGKAVAGKEDSREILSYAARLGLELGADIIKIPYNGNKEDFAWVVKAAGKAKVVMSGGPKTETREDFLKMVGDILSVGAVGVAVGRNVWQDENPLEISQQLADLIFEKSFAKI